ncbi:MAG: carboxylating nicotinate-nucleotide diphosphorylase [Oleibacter sp.]|nr:carboxylating nicotinate-nucleotide diphosphorylase [Thalassolituus sp.]
MDLTQHLNDIQESVARALAEDIGLGKVDNPVDITALLIPADEQSKARVITRDRAVIAGRPWVDEVFRQVDPSVTIDWKVNEGDLAQPNEVLFELQGNARALLTGERSALNFLQTLSGTATLCHHYASLVEGTGVKLLDTRKTLPGLRIAQKYAVTMGGCFNHRIGLYDAFLIKENHIMAAGSITAAVKQAKVIDASKPVEVEVENMQQLDEAIDAGANIIMLDNFTPEQMRTAVAHCQQRSAESKQERVKLEASGGINQDTLRSYAETGVDFISIGALTKDCKATDLSMRMIGGNYLAF